MLDAESKTRDAFRCPAIPTPKAGRPCHAIAQPARHSDLAGHCYTSSRFGTRCPRYFSNKAAYDRRSIRRSPSTRSASNARRSRSVRRSRWLLSRSRSIRRCLDGTGRLRRMLPNSLSPRSSMASSSARYSGGTFSSEGVAARTMFTNAVSRDWFIPLACAADTVVDVFGQFQRHRRVAHERFLSAVVRDFSRDAGCRDLRSLHRLLDLNTWHRRVCCREAIGQVVLRGSLIVGLSRVSRVRRPGGGRPRPFTVRSCPTLASR